MKKNFICILYLFICVHTIKSQTIDWFETIGTKRSIYHPDWEHYRLAGIQGDDSTLVIGGSNRRSGVYFYQAQDSLREKGQTYGIENKFIAKFGVDGSLCWKKKLGGGGLIDDAAIAYHNGNTYFASVFSDKMAIDKDTFNSIRSALFLVKYDKNGKREWLKLSSSFFYSNDIIPRKIVVDASENVYIVGDSQGYNPLSFDNISTAEQTYQFVFKFDKNGTPLNAYSLKERDPKKWNLRLNDVHVDKKGNIYTLLTDGGLGVTSSCKYSSWQSKVMKITPEGVISTLFILKSDDLMSASSFIRMPNGDFIVTGSYRGQLSLNNFKTEDQACKTTIGFLSRITEDGKVLWFNKGESSLFSHGFDLFFENDYSFITTSVQKYNDSNRDPNLNTSFPNGRTRLLVKRMSGFGKTIDSVEYNISGSDLDFYSFKTFKSKSGVYVAGNYECFFDKQLESTCGEIDAHGQKIFLLKAGKDVLKKEYVKPFIEENGVSIEPNPSSGSLYFRLDKAIDETVTLRFYDINGRVVKTKTIDGTIVYQNFEIDELVSGLYLLQIQSKNINIVKKLVKQ